MSNQHFYHPQVIYTRLKDVFNDETNKNKIKKNENLPEEKKKYINKELVESWIEAIKSSN